jgi:hypothetical protein
MAGHCVLDTKITLAFCGIRAGVWGNGRLLSFCMPRGVKNEGIVSWGNIFFVGSDFALSIIRVLCSIAKVVPNSSR